MTEIQLLEGVASVGRDEWNALAGDASPFLEWEWLASLEEAGCVRGESGWSARPLIGRVDGELVAACPLYIKGHSEGEFVFDWSWADAAERSGLSYYPKLLVGVPFTPAGGERFLVAPGQDRARWIEAFAGALVDICGQNDFSSVHVNFCLPDEARALERAGFLQRLGLQYHWSNHGYRVFDDWLEHFRSKRRNQIRRERREMKSHEVEIRAHTGDDIDDELFEPMFRFYLATIRARYWGRQYLNRDFYELLRQRFKQRLCFVVARRRGRVIAGTTNVWKGDAMYGRYWGCDEELRHLHFNVCYYAAVDFCIERGLQRFEPGAGGDYKQLRGFDARPTYSAHWIAHPGLRKAIADFLGRERIEVEHTLGWMHENSALKHEPEKS